MTAFRLPVVVPLAVGRLRGFARYLVWRLDRMLLGPDPLDQWLRDGWGR